MSDRRLRSPTLYPIELRALTLAGASNVINSATVAHEIPTANAATSDGSTRVPSAEKLPALSVLTLNELLLSSAITVDGVPIPRHAREFCERFGPIIYFVRSDKTGLLKIGFTSFLQQRLSGLRREDGGKVRLVTWRLGDRNEEMRLHGRFVDYRVRGEWFRPARRLMTYVGLVHAALVKQWGWAFDPPITPPVQAPAGSAR